MFKTCALATVLALFFIPNVDAQGTKAHSFPYKRIK